MLLLTLLTSAGGINCPSLGSPSLLKLYDGAATHTCSFSSCIVGVGLVLAQHARSIHGGQHPAILLPDAQLASAGAAAPAVDVANALRTAAALLLCNSEAAGLLYGLKTSPANPGTCSCLRHTVTIYYCCKRMLVGIKL